MQIKQPQHLHKYTKQSRKFPMKAKKCELTFIARDASIIPLTRAHEAIGHLCTGSTYTRVGVTEEL